MPSLQYNNVLSLLVLMPKAFKQHSLARKYSKSNVLRILKYACENSLSDVQQNMSNRCVPLKKTCSSHRSNIFMFLSSLCHHAVVFLPKLLLLYTAIIFLLCYRRIIYIHSLASPYNITLQIPFISLSEVNRAHSFAL